MIFAEELRSWCNTSTGPYRRPFAPNTNWESASIFVIGTNPATPLRNEFSSFDQYWKGITEQPDIFSEKYSIVHSGRASKSTHNAKILLDLLDPLNVLVTNVVWFPVQRKKHIPSSEWDFGPSALTKLIDHVQPKVIFCHGADAEAFGKTYSPKIDRYMPPEEQLLCANGSPFVFAYHHFSGQGLRRGAKFQPQTDLPLFANAIRKCL